MAILPGITASHWRLLGGVAVIVFGGLIFASGADAFFPIGVWLQNPTNAARYRDAGINTYVGLWQGPTGQQLDTLQSAGLRLICSQNDTALRHPAATNIIAWIHQDEPDNATTWGARLGLASPVPPREIQAAQQRMKAVDPTRPVLLILGQGVAWDGWYGRGNRNNHPEDYPEYLKGCDVASFDIYPVNHGSVEVAGNLWFVADGIKRLRKWTNEAKPVWNCIETTRIDLAGRKPTPHEVRAQVWMSLIHGSRGIIYFVHQFKPTFVEAALLTDPEMLAAITVLNRQLADLAPVLNSADVSTMVRVKATNAAVPIATLVKRLDGYNYLFAVAMRPGTNTVSFTFDTTSAGRTVEVIGENRTLRAVEGTFTDHFRPWDVHLYRFESGSGR